MNVPLYGIVRKGIYEYFEVYGINYGFAGLVLVTSSGKLNPSDVSDLIGRGGTFLYSVLSRMQTRRTRKKEIEQLKRRTKNEPRLTA